MAITKLNRGDQFTDLTVLNIDLARQSKKGQYYKCKCVCGVNISVLDSHLTSGKIVSHRVTSSAPCKIIKVSMIGQIYGDFEVLKKAQKIPGEPQRYRVRCTKCSAMYSKQGCAIVGGRGVSCSKCKGLESKTSI
jgi:hypothetical protein